MNGPSLLQIDSVDEFRAHQAQWDDLWLRSDLASPTARAEHLALWLRHFAPDARFRAIVVRKQDRWTAALPLVQRRVARVARAGTMPSNCWSTAGDLLLDASVDDRKAVDLLVAGMRGLPWSLLKLEDLDLDSSRWLAFVDALDRAGIRPIRRTEGPVGRLDISGGWEEYRKSWPAKHRQNIARCERRLAKEGPITFEFLRQIDPGEAEPLVRRAFEIEHCSWKQDSGTSVLSQPEIYDFYLQQAKLLARHGHFALAFLESGGRDIAFDYGWTAKGVYFGLKTGYDAGYSQIGPGQLLRRFIIERLFDDPQYRAYDFLGPMSGALAKWNPDTYTVGSLTFAPGKLLARTALAAYQHIAPVIRRTNVHS